MLVQQKYRDTPQYGEIFERLKLAAANKRKVGYAALFKIMNLKGGNHAAKEAGHLLREISEETHSKGQPMLTAIVVSQGTGRPGPGFYELAVKLGKLQAKATEKELFWRLEVNRVYSTAW
jgi:hypothetical protein